VLALVLAQGYLSRATHRTFNLPLLAAPAHRAAGARAPAALINKVHLHRGANRLHAVRGDRRGAHPRLRERGDEALASRPTQRSAYEATSLGAEADHR